VGHTTTHSTTEKSRTWTHQDHTYGEEEEEEKDKEEEKEEEELRRAALCSLPLKPRTISP